MPQILRTAAEYFPGVDLDIFEPRFAIAKGSVLYLEMLAKKGKGGVTLGPVPGTTGLTHSYGFQAIRFDDDKKMIYNLLYKDTKYSGTISAKTEDYFVAYDNHQTRVVFIVYESDFPCGDTPWKDFDGSEAAVNGIKVTVQIPPEYLDRARDYHLWVTFNVTATGLFELIVTDEQGKRVGYQKQQI